MFDSSKTGETGGKSGTSEGDLVYLVCRCIWFNQTNETDQINKGDQPVLALVARIATFSAWREPMPWP